MGLAPNSSLLARLNSDLAEVAGQLCLAAILSSELNIKHLNRDQLPAYLEGLVNRYLDGWIRQALAGLSRHLEACALNQDEPFRRPDR